MPRLKRVLGDLRLSGPRLPVTIEPTLDVQRLLRENGETIPSISVEAIVDTGASGTFIQTQVFEQLGREPFTFAYLRTPSTTEPLLRGVYRIRVVIAEDITFEVDAVEGPLEGQGLQCLIGRDILQHLLLTYDGPRSRFTLTLQ